MDRIGIPTALVAKASRAALAHFLLNNSPADPTLVKIRNGKKGFLYVGVCRPSRLGIGVS